MNAEDRQKLVEKFIAKYPKTKDDRFIYRDDRDCIEWICPRHGVGHPIWDAHANYVHGCCGCCSIFRGWLKSDKGL